MEAIIVLVFVAGYLLIALEHPVRINKTATALITGAACWGLFALDDGGILRSNEHYQQFMAQAGGGDTIHAFLNSSLAESLAQISGILFFLLGAMTIVELIDAHHGFRFITDRITTLNIRKLLWIVCWVTFFLSSILDNLTTAIIMVSLTRKLVQEDKPRLLFAGMIIIAANAGGAWSPIGDVTTTMLWIGGQVTSLTLMKQLILPSMVCLLAPLLWLTFRLKGQLEPRITIGQDGPDPEYVKGGRIMLFVGVGSLAFVPVFKTLTHLPPYMGVLLGLGVLWVISELINPELDEFARKKYTVASALTRVDIPSVLFFMGILLAVAALESMQTLHHFANSLQDLLGDNRIIISFIGVVSAIVDNVPLVAACMGMYSMDVFPSDHLIWEYLAYCAGTGGSLLVIGSAAGVAVMGMEKLDFLWYVKNISLLAFIGYAFGAGWFLLFQ